MGKTKSSNPLTRINNARREIGATDVSPTIAAILSGLFIFIIVIPSLLQLIVNPSLFREPPPTIRNPHTSDFMSAITESNRSLLNIAEHLTNIINERSVVVDVIRPRIQKVMTGLLNAGTESVYTGSDRWLFFGSDIRYVTGQPFLSPSVLQRRSISGDTLRLPPQPDPRLAILDLHRILQERGIELVIMPTPTKPSVHPEQLGSLSASTPQNASFKQFVKELRDEGIMVLDLIPLFSELKKTTNHSLYLATDTHWRPETMIKVASLLAAFIDEHVELPPAGQLPYRSYSREITNIGDTTRLLNLTIPERLFPPESVSIRRITPVNNTQWRSNPDAGVMLLGDSFTNIYSLGTMGWGESAGLAEQLSYELGRPVDRISQNDGGAHAPREQLATEIARSPNRLDAKRVVVYQFSERELAHGDWRMVDFDELRKPNLSTFTIPKSGQRITVSGRIEEIGPIPTPGSVPYKDHIVGLHLSALNVVSGPKSLTRTNAVVYVWAMQDNDLTEAAQYRIGDVVTLDIEPWFDISNVLDGINRGELSTLSLRLVEPWWGQSVNHAP